MCIVVYIMIFTKRITLFEALSCMCIIVFYLMTSRIQLWIFTYTEGSLSAVHKLLYLATTPNHDQICTWLDMDLAHGNNPIMDYFIWHLIFSGVLFNKEDMTPRGDVTRSARLRMYRSAAVVGPNIVLYTNNWPLVLQVWTPAWKKHTNLTFGEAWRHPGLILACQHVSREININ